MLRTSQRSLTACPDITTRHRSILFDELGKIALLAISDLRGRLIGADALIILASLRNNKKNSFKRISEMRGKVQTLIVLFAVWHVPLHCVHCQGNVVQK